jgi:hypothetical protein
MAPRDKLNWREIIIRDIIIALPVTIIGGVVVAIVVAILTGWGPFAKKSSTTGPNLIPQPSSTQTALAYFSSSETQSIISTITPTSSQMFMQIKPTFTLTPTSTSTLTSTNTKTPSPTSTPTPIPIMLALPFTDNFDKKFDPRWTLQGNYSLSKPCLKAIGDPLAGDTFTLKLDYPLSEYTLSFDCKGCGISYYDDVVFKIAERLEYSIGRVQYMLDLIKNLKIFETGYTDSEGHFEFRIKGNTYSGFANNKPTFDETTYGDVLVGPLTITVSTNGVAFCNFSLIKSK